MSHKNSRPRMPKIKKYHISSKDREYFTSNLSILMKAAVPIGEALQSLGETTRKGSNLQKALLQMEKDIDQGISLADALDRCGIVSTQTLTMVKFGEQSGRLAENLSVAAKQEQKQNIFRSKVRSAMLYPTFVLSMVLVVGLGVSWFLLPRLANTFAQLKVDLPLISKIFIGFGQFLGQNGVWFVPVFLIGMFTLGYILFFAPGTRRVGQFLLLHTPGIGRLIREVEIARFGYLFGTLLGAGVGVIESLELLYDSSSNPRYKKLYRYLRDSFKDGYSLKASLRKYKGINGIIPPAVQQMVIAGERSGSLAETLVEVGDIYGEKADITTDNLEVIIEPFMLVIVAGGVLGVAVAVILPIYSLVGNLGGS